MIWVDTGRQAKRLKMYFTRFRYMLSNENGECIGSGEKGTVYSLLISIPIFKLYSVNSIVYVF